MGKLNCGEFCKTCKNHTCCNNCSGLYTYEEFMLARRKYPNKVVSTMSAIPYLDKETIDDLKGLPGFTHLDYLQTTNIRNTVHASGSILSKNYVGFFFMGRPRICEDEFSLSSERNPDLGKIRCAFMTDNGCSLTLEERPFQCGALVPSSDYCHCDCTATDIELLYNSWVGHQEEMLNLNIKEMSKLRKNKELFKIGTDIRDLAELLDNSEVVKKFNL